MATIDELRALPDTTAAVAFEGDGFTVYRVEGPGISTQVRDDDEQTMQGLVDSHDERVAQQDETLAETQLRWHADPDHDFELPAEQVEALEQQVAAQREAASG